MNKYLKIKNDVRNKIISGVYKPGAILPGENDFIGLYHTSKMTVKHAMDELVREGLIIKRRGSGTFVKELSQDELENFKVINQFQGSTALFSDKKIMSDVLTFEVISATPFIMDKLGVDGDTKLYHVRRLRFVDDEPYVIENSFMPTEIVQDLTLKICQASIYEYIEEKLKLAIGSAHRHIEARRGTDEETKLLELAVGDPVVIASQTAYLTDGRAFEYSENVHRYDKYGFETVLIRKN
ncbi:MAG: GntR family transcriptional regulator [Lactococcus hircilactis]